jgi:hypothetical protein
MTTPAESARRRAEKAIRTGHPVGGGPCPQCGHTLACHWPGGCIRCGCKRETAGQVVPLE